MTARHVAQAGGCLASWMSLDRCSSSEVPPCTWAPVAIWESPDSGCRSPLCQSHVDRWFDAVDESPDLEPASVRWLDGSRVLVGVS